MLQLKKNNYKLPKNANDAIKEKLTYSPAIMNKLRECIRVQAGKAKELFKTELLPKVLLKMRIPFILVPNPRY